MADSNRERIGKGLEVLAKGLRPFVDQHMSGATPGGKPWWEMLGGRDGKTYSPDDPLALLVAMTDNWAGVFRQILGQADRNYASELRTIRNNWAHNNAFNVEDTIRALDTMERLLTSVSAADQAAAVRRMRHDVQRAQFDREAHREAARAAAATADMGVAGLRPWRDAAIPHADVRSGDFAQAEFAADLWQVAGGQGGPEYVDPVEFFQRTYLTVGLRELLTQAGRRVTSSGGSPVVDLQTSFGGGKTHSILALYHLFSGRELDEFPDDVQDLIRTEVGVPELPEVSRAVLVGTALSPGEPRVKDDGTEVNTLWGELAWQLGGRESYEIVAKADRTRTNPGDALRTLFERHAPVLVLIDEWVAYARQFFARDDLPGGTFDTQFTFAQALTEQVNAVPGALLVVSIPASDRGESYADTEVGGVGGLEALKRLRHVVQRLDSPWRPATSEESFNIVRRRLFEPFVDGEAYRARNATAKGFVDFYRRDQGAEFPSECRDPAYEDRIKNAYPIHPELFARLYEDWSTLEKFQRTRGVLRLMAKVIHELWEAGDQAPLIMPGSLPLADPEIEGELTRILDDGWKPVIDADIDGVGSLPMEIDRTPRFGQRHAARRVARTVFLGSAPTHDSPNQGLEEQRIRLGVVLPGEQTAVFNDALRRLTQRATYLYVEGDRYWYSLRQSVNRKARDIAERLRGQEDRVEARLVTELGKALEVRGTCFTGVHVAPASTAEVSDEPRCRLVALGPAATHVKSGTSAALESAEEILRTRGNAGRSYRNMLIFLAPDAGRMQDLQAAVRDLMAWEEIEGDADKLDAYQRGHVGSRLTSARQAVSLRLAETYQWLLVPSGAAGSPDVEWEKLRFDGHDGLAQRASEKLLAADLVRVEMAPVFVGTDLRGVLAPLWEPGHVSVSKLWETYATYLYLARMRDMDVLVGSVRTAPGYPAWDVESFAVAATYDETTGRYGGLVVDDMPSAVTASTLLVKPDAARAQPCERCGRPVHQGRCEEKTCARCGAPAHSGPCSRVYEQRDDLVHEEPRDVPSARPRRFHGAVALNPERMGKDLMRIQQEVLAHLQAAESAGISVTLEVHAESAGYEDGTVRTVSENARTLKFDQFGFEES